MKRNAGQVLIIAGDELGLSALELALLQKSTHVLRTGAPVSHRLFEKTEPDIVLVDPVLLDSASEGLLSNLDPQPTIVALVRDTEPETLRAAMRIGARDYLEKPLSANGVGESEMLLDKLAWRRGGGTAHKSREASSQSLLKQQIQELSERYVTQCRSFDEAQDVFYLDLSRMMTIFDNIMDGIVFADPDGQVTLMNPVAEDCLGVKTIFAIGKPIEDLGHGELAKEIKRDHDLSMIDGGVSERTLEVQDASANLRYLKLRTTAVTDYKGSFAGILTVIKDVTGEYKSEQMKNQYLSIVSHELRTPLTGIKTFATLMAKGSLGELHGEQQGVMDSIREQVLRLEHEVDKLICLARIESDDFAADMEVFGILALLDSVTAPFEQTARDRAIEFEVIPCAGNPRVRADKADLRRAVQALIENAVKFTPDGGRIEIRVDEADGEVRLHVRDNGPGVDPRYQRRIFEKFFQVENPLTRHHGGAGLGLCVANGVAQAHGGRVEVESDLGAGSDFSISLPRADMGAYEEAGSP